MTKPTLFAIAAVACACVQTSSAIAAPLHAMGNGVLPTRPLLRRVHTPPHPPRHRWHINPFAHSGHGKPGTWTPLNAASPFGANGAGTALLLTDGTVMVSDNEATWYRLTPDQNGSYINGTWSSPITLPSGYGPLYFASAVLPDGRLEIEGGEYNFFNGVETNLGAIYDPLANAWTSVSPPAGWTEIGDAQSAVLADGTMMIGNCCYSSQALLNASSLTWTQTGSGKADPNSEESWTLLPDGTVLAVDVINANHAERYDPKTGSWSSAGTAPVNLIAAEEIGPQVLRPDGTVFVAGATGHTAIYNTLNAQWSAGPDFPVVGGRQLGVTDGPGALLPDGNVLVAGSPAGTYDPPATFFEFNGTNLVPAANPPDAPNDPSFAFRLLVLPNGQVLETDFSDDVEVYTPHGKPLRGLAPRIKTVPTTLARGNTYVISGKRFNGASQTNMYGDDAQAATNYPLVRITNNATGHVFYARTHNHSSMAVASSKLVSTNVDIGNNIETGSSSLVVIANGIASKPVSVTIQ